MSGFPDGVVGIDPSFTGFGLARTVLAKNHQHFVFKTIKTSVKQGSRLDRILLIWDECRSFMFRSDVVFMEDYAYSVGRQKRSGQSLAQLGELCGIINLFVTRWTGREIIKLTPGQWKKFLSGNGNLKKDEFKLKVYKKFGLETDTNDSSVAVAICDLGSHVCMDGEFCRDLNKYEVDVLKTINKLHGEELGPLREVIREQS